MTCQSPSEVKVYTDLPESELVVSDFSADSSQWQETKAQLARLATLEQQLQKMEETEKKVLSIWVRFGM